MPTQDELAKSRRFLTSDQSARIQALTQQPIEKKKPKKKKQKKAQHAEEQGVATLSSRPGKNRLRKMKYQQKQLEPIDYLPIAAQNAKFTQSVVMDESLLVVRKEEDTKHSSTNRVVQVITSSVLPASTDKSTIHIQPLLVLDLNGILCHRIRRHKMTHPISSYRSSIAHIATTPIIPRTNINEFLTFLDQHFCLAVWTSAKAKTATQLIQKLIPSDIAQRLLFVWAQHHCDSIHTDDNDGPIFEKDLSQVWKEYPLWNVSNTLLMDDSPDKCTRWHENAIHPPPLDGLLATNDEMNVQRQQIFLEELVQHWTDCNVTQVWDEESGDATLSDSTQQVRFLQEHAVEHMGWE